MRKKEFLVVVLSLVIIAIICIIISDLRKDWSQFAADLVIALITVSLGIPIALEINRRIERRIAKEKKILDTIIEELDLNLELLSERKDLFDQDEEIQHELDWSSPKFSVNLILP